MTLALTKQQGTHNTLQNQTDSKDDHECWVLVFVFLKLIMKVDT